MMHRTFYAARYLPALLLVASLNLDTQAGEWVAFWEEYEPGKPYAVWDHIDTDWGDPTWVADIGATVPSESPYHLLGNKSYAIQIRINGAWLDYVGNGVWQVGDATATFQGADGYEQLDPSWFDFETPPDIEWDLAYPYVEVADLAPGDSDSWQYVWQWENQPSWYSALWRGATFGFAVPEPTCLSLLAVGGLAVMRRRAFSGSA